MYSANRCTCSARALELFVRDFAGLEIHNYTRRPSLARLGTSIRRIGTRPALAIQRSTAARLGTHISSASGHDDLFVPFDLSRQDTSANGLLSDSPIRDDSTTTALLANENLDDFEPELEIHPNGTTVQTAERDTAPELLDSSQHPPPVDATAPPILAATGCIDAPNQPHVYSDTAVPTETRAESRKKRKIRRLEAKKVEEERVQEADRAAKEALNKEKKRQRRINAREGPTAPDMDTASPEALEREFAELSAIQSIKAAKSAEESARATKSSDTASPAQMLADERQEKWKREREAWMVQKAALEGKFGEQNWNPRKRISPDALAGIRALHSNQPDMYTTPVLAAHFKVSAEAIRRILKSKWQPKEEEVESRKARWEKRGEKKWSEMVEQGIRPPKKWREMGVGRVVGKGEVPAWKRGSHAKTGRAGERWIEHAPTDVFETAGDMVVERSHVEPSIAERIL